MDFSHIISFPEPDYDDSILPERIRSTIPEQYHTVVFKQVEKLKQLQQQKTQRMVYVYMDIMAVPPPEGIQNIQKWNFAIGISLQEFNQIAGDISITIISPVPNAEESYKKQCKIAGIECNIKEFIASTKRDITWCWKNSHPESTSKIDYDCEYLFNITNGKAKLYRLMLMKELWDSKLLDRAVWSWGRHRAYDFDYGLDMVNTTFPYLETKRLDEIAEDDKGNPNPAWDNSVWPMPADYNKCYIEVMVEYMGAPDQIFFTEKTFRSYYNSKPCLQLSHYGHYYALQDIGVKLYDEMFDYDIIEQVSLGKRIAGIVENLKRLSQLTNSEMDELIKTIEPKIQHNYELFCNLTPEPFPIKELDWLWDNMLLPGDMWTPIRLDKLEKIFLSQ
jgi:hypothetical protein